MFFEAVVEPFADVPDGLLVVEASAGAGGDDGVVHEPMVILAEGDPVLWTVVFGLAEGDEVGGIDEVYIIKEEAHTAGGTADIVDFADHTSEGCGTYPFRAGFVGRRFLFEEFLFLGFDLYFIMHGVPHLIGNMIAVMLNQCGLQGFASNGIVQQEKQLGIEGGKGYESAQFAGATDRCAMWQCIRTFQCRAYVPEAFALEVEERIVGGIFVGVLAGDIKEGAEDIEQAAVVLDAVFG